MIRNYIISIWRHLIRNRLFAMINIIGLGTGIACVILFYLWVGDEISFDRFHVNGDRIYNLISVFPRDDRNSMSVTPFPLTPALKDKFPEVETYSRYWRFPALVQNGEIMYLDEKVHLVDPGFLEMFSFPLLSGDPLDAFSSKSAVAITESEAFKYFGTGDPIGKTITLNQDLKLSVVAVLEDPPANTAFDFSMLASILHVPEFRLYDDWSFAGQAYILLKKGSDPEKFQEKVGSIYTEVNPDSGVKLMIQPLKELHLREDGKARKLILVYIFSGIAVVILLLACINYMNLSTAFFLKRSRETGLRKIHGASRGQVISQFLGESMFYAFLSLFIALILVELVRPLFNTLTQKQLELHYGDPELLAGLFGIYLFTTLVSGLYPASKLSSFQPVRLTGPEKVWSGGKRFLNGLIIFQFTVSIALIIISVTINRQVKYIHNKDLGMNKDNIIVLPFGRDMVPIYEMLREKIISHPDVVNVSGSYDLPFLLTSAVDLTWDGAQEDEEILVSYNMVDFDFIETMEIEILEGRTFSRDHADDDSIAYIINETAMKRIGLDHVSGLDIDFLHPHLPEYLRKGTIIGVVKDFNIQPLKEEISPLVLRIYRPFYRNLYIRYSSTDPSPLLDYLQGMQEELYPDLPFQYSFLDLEADRMYETEFRTGRIIKYFTLISIFISCLGLFGMVIFDLELRIQEIAIRKVLASSIGQIVSLIMYRYVKWILIAFLIASPISYFITDRWLQGFSYRITISLLTYLLTLVGIIVIAFLTIGIQARRSALVNPAQLLKYE